MNNESQTQWGEVEERENMEEIGSGMVEQRQRRDYSRKLTLATCPYSRALPPEAIPPVALFFTASLAEVMLAGSLTADLRKVDAALSCMASTLKLCMEFGSSVGHPVLLVSLSLHLSSSLAKPLLFVPLLCPKHHRHK